MPQLIDGQSISDFRSDTVTRPSQAMRQAMATAEVGDDVMQEDPTINELERQAAAAFGKEAALLVPSGTMGNLIATKVHTRPGDEIFVESLSHTYNNEAGGVSLVAGVMTRTLIGEQGRIDPAEVARYARPESLHSPGTRLLIVENTHNFWGGKIVPLEHLEKLWALTRERGIRLHIDGARIWNAVVASGVPAEEWGRRCDSLYFCLSKGLGAPVGSVMVGSEEFIGEARRTRKLLGGGMRQAGVLAAAGLIALDAGVKRLGEDHANARALFEGMQQIEGVVVDPAGPDTNILFMKTEAGPASYPKIADALGEQGILAYAIDDLGIRFCTHVNVDRQDVERCLAALGELVPAHGRAGAAARA